MSNISISITPELESYLDEAVKSGEYDNRSSVIRKALVHFRREMAYQRIKQAHDEVQEGHGVTFTGNLQKMVDEYTE